MAEAHKMPSGGEGEQPGGAPAVARVMRFVCQQDGEVLLLDPETGEMLSLPADRAYPDVWALEPAGDVRVILAGGQPVWVTGGAPPSPTVAGPFLEFLGSHRHTALVVEFDDGDRYPASALDLSGENPDGEFEICVKFADSIGRSHAEAVARAAGSLRRSPPGTAWTSTIPPEPVGFRYTASRVRVIYDQLTGLPVYERDQIP